RPLRRRDDLDALRAQSRRGARVGLESRRSGRGGLHELPLDVVDGLDASAGPPGFQDVVAGEHIRRHPPGAQPADRPIDRDPTRPGGAGGVDARALADGALPSARLLDARGARGRAPRAAELARDTPRAAPGPRVSTPGPPAPGRRAGSRRARAYG